MNDALLRAAAANGLASFGVAWIGQGGANDAATILTMYTAFLSPRITPPTGGGGAGTGGGTGIGYTSPASSGSVFNPGTLLENFLKSATITPHGATEGFQDWAKIGDLPGGIGELLRDPIKAIGSGIGKIADLINGYTKQQEFLLEKVNQESGLTGELSAGFRREITDSVPAANKLGIHFGEIAESVSNMVTESGRFKLINQETIEQVALSSRMFGTMSELMKSMPSFEKVSMGVSDASKVIESSYKSSVGLGLVGRESTKTIAANLEKLNQYGFKNGIEGLTRMVQRSQELKISMDQAFKIADEVMDPTKALEMSSRLQVIGGAMGDFNDPIKMMYMATNDVNGLQEALAKSAESLVTFNQQTGRFQIVGADLRRAREMAGAMGLETKELTNLAITSMQRTSAAADLMVSGLKIDDDQREFLTNMSQMKGGRMVIEVPKNLRDELGLTGENTSLALENMSQSQAEYLLKNQEFFKELTSEDIARQQFGLLQNIENQVNAIKSAAMIQVGLMADSVKKAYGLDPKNMKDILSHISRAEDLVSKKMTDAAKPIVAHIGNAIKGKLGGLSKENKTPENKPAPWQIKPPTNASGSAPTPKTNQPKPANITPNPIKPANVGPPPPPDKKTSEVNVKPRDTNVNINHTFTWHGNLADKISREFSTNPDMLANIKDSYYDLRNPSDQNYG